MGFEVRTSPERTTKSIYLFNTWGISGLKKGSNLSWRTHSTEFWSSIGNITSNILYSYAISYILPFPIPYVRSLDFSLHWPIRDDFQLFAPNAMRTHLCSQFPFLIFHSYALYVICHFRNWDEKLAGIGGIYSLCVGTLWGKQKMATLGSSLREEGKTSACKDPKQGWALTQEGLSLVS